MNSPRDSSSGKLVFATRNQGKIAELSGLVKPLGLTVIPAADLNAPDVEEDGDTFEANATKKAREVADFTGLPALADDSGLAVDALNGAPGVYSARFAGPDATDADNNRLLLERLQGVPKNRRGAHFCCAMALADPNGALGDAVEVTHGRCHGVLLEELRGEGGFGYDPLFFVPDHRQTFAELGAAIKNTISHRAMAMSHMQIFLKRYFG